jgi:hypothetical protein
MMCLLIQPCSLLCGSCSSVPGFAPVRALASFTAYLTANQLALANARRYLPIRDGKPDACDLLMVQGVTPAHKGLAPSRLMDREQLSFDSEKMPMRKSGTHIKEGWTIMFWILPLAREEVTRKPKKSDLEDLQKAHSPMDESAI